MDLRKIVPRILSAPQIREQAEQFRQEYIHNEDVPVDIELIMQSSLGIQVIPIEDLQQKCHIEGFISMDLKFIYVDEFQYVTDNYYKRVRFTIAHEIGHRILHRDIIDKTNFESADEWKKFRLSLRDESLGWFEWQAREFAGRLLVPIDRLVTEFKAARNEIIRNNPGWKNLKIGDELFSLVAPLIAPKFDVSTDVIEIRLIKEGVSNYFN
ncbi:MAG: ImmA/IrrE family metallo-endopeptidase [Bacteroidales bacterium]|nr:ImmA/IrrE family metallo-endopeptidase [Bacteroidales bacterium]